MTMHAIAPSNDAALIADLIRRAFADVADRLGLTPESWRWHPSNYTPEKVRQSMAKGVCFHVLSCDGEPCGCVGIDPVGPDVYKLRRLAVVPEYQRRGLGRALVRYALDQAADLGAKRVEIGAIAEEAHLMDWYAGLGFVVTTEGIRYDHLPFTVTRMAAPVPPEDSARDGEAA